MTRELADLPEVIVVLGGGLGADGTPTPSTIARAEAAADLAQTRDVAIIVSGSHGNGPPPAKTEAAYMADRLRERGVAPERVFLEDQSRDTLSNAAFVAERYLQH
ncbi:MAG TPA: YdcF family protein, partial [Candidatus Acidoferrales bacterium]|nr:YdcF family protein [Candidatus Acidoferrales bacterium]